MSALDELVAAVNGSAKIDAGTKGVLTTFLREGGPALGTVAPAMLQDVVEQLAGANRAAAIDSLADSLNEAQVVALLDETQQEMEGALGAQESRRAAGQAVLAALEQAALTVVMQAILSAL